MAGQCHKRPSCDIGRWHGTHNLLQASQDLQTLPDPCCPPFNVSHVSEAHTQPRTTSLQAACLQCNLQLTTVGTRCHACQAGHTSMTAVQQEAGMNRSRSCIHIPVVTLRSSAPRPTFMPGASPSAASCCRAVARLLHRLHMRPASRGCSACRLVQEWYMDATEPTRSSKALGVQLLPDSATPHAGICRTAPSCRQPKDKSSQQGF